MRLFLNEKEVPVLMRALSLILSNGSMDEIRIAQTLLERIATCNELQGHKPRMKG